ncbi:hypothetical protein MUK42_33065 [Musa troglodytarum]|uniref:Uncharacterized protein n=1 Tax=Musa troglodytarum TaxID=320322 RepID=A0A9E7I9F1_9LILI|nr:hypothetical protein MUK42_33065 [Musa troglodytarum]
MRATLVGFCSLIGIEMTTFRNAVGIRESRIHYASASHLDAAARCLPDAVVSPEFPRILIKAFLGKNNKEITEEKSHGQNGKKKENLGIRTSECGKQSRSRSNTVVVVVISTLPVSGSLSLSLQLLLQRRLIAPNPTRRQQPKKTDFAPSLTLSSSRVVLCGWDIRRTERVELRAAAAASPPAPPLSDTAAVAAATTTPCCPQSNCAIVAFLRKEEEADARKLE